MSLRRFLSRNRNAEADRSSLESDRPPSFASTVNTTSTRHSLSRNLNHNAEADRSPLESDRPPSFSSTVNTASTRQFLSRNRIAETDRSSLESDRSPSFSSNVNTASTRQFLSRNGNVEADWSSLESDRSPSFTSNVNTVSTRQFLIRNGNVEADRSSLESDSSPSFTPNVNTVSTRQFLSRNRNAEADRSSLESDRPPSFTSYNVNTMSSHNRVSRHDSMRPPEYHWFMDTLSVAETSKVATPSPNYIYYRIYAEDGAIPSKTPVDPGDPFLGRIKARSVPPPRTAQGVKCSIAKVENIEDREGTSLFLTPYSQSPMDDAGKFTTHNGTGPGSTPQEPLALVAMMSDSERSALESESRGGLASVAELDTASPEMRYVYYVLYADDYEMPSKVAFDPEEPSLGRIRADSVAPPHSPTSILRCISRVESNPAIVNANLFADTSCDSDTPLKEGHISLGTDGPGLSPNEPMAIVQVKKSPGPLLTPPLSPLATIPDGKYLIKSRAADIYWSTWSIPMETVHFWTTKHAKDKIGMQWDITHDTNGNIFITSTFITSTYAMISPLPKRIDSWVGAEITGSAVPVPWRLLRADSKFYYLTTDMNLVSRNPRVPAAQPNRQRTRGFMTTLKVGDQWQMWEFIRI